MTASAESVTAVFGCPPGGGPACTGRLVCAWRDGYVPTGADAALIGLPVDHAVAWVHRERTTGTVVDVDAARHVGLAPDGTRRVAAATGILMTLHHLTLAQARLLLTRASDPNPPLGTAGRRHGAAHRGTARPTGVAVRTTSPTGHRPGPTYTAAGHVSPGRTVRHRLTDKQRGGHRSRIPVAAQSSGVTGWRGPRRCLGVTRRGMRCPGRTGRAGCPHREG